MNRILVLALMFLTIAGWAADADANGKWKATVEGQQGTIDVEYTFKVEGEKLTGSAAGPMGEIEISDGSQKGDEITFTIVAGERSLVHKGKIVDDELKIVLDLGQRQMEFTAKRVKP